MIGVAPDRRCADSHPQPPQLHRQSAGHDSGGTIGSRHATGAARFVVDSDLRPARRGGDRGARRLHARPSRARTDRADDRTSSERLPPSASAIDCRCTILNERNGTAGLGLQRDARPARGVVRSDAALHRRRLARTADTVDGHSERRRSRPSRSARRGKRIAASSAACSRKSIASRGSSIGCSRLSRPARQQPPFALDTVDFAALGRRCGVSSRRAR